MDMSKSPSIIVEAVICVKKGDMFVSDAIVKKGA